MIEAKACFVIERDLSLMYIDDNVGVQDANNLTGYGSPNPDRRNFAILLVGYFKPADKPFEVLDIPNQLVYSNSFENTEKTRFSIPYLKDGYHDFHLFYIPDAAPDSNDGTVYYNTALGQVLISNDGTFEAVNDYMTLIGNNSLLSLNTPQFPLGKISNDYRAENIKLLDYMISNDPKYLKQQQIVFDYFTKINGVADVFLSGAYASAQNYLEKIKTGCQ